eukprot:GILI01002861.1.p1 GENE.GILI01002861.1~~GILI01002861.1.p1  ORF type:complete len:362 (-),score=105.24 GILI01002861.1:1015-2016(-)
MDSNPITLNRWILQQQQQHPDARGDLTILLSSITLACKSITTAVRKAGLANLYGLAGDVNSSGDDQKKLDVLSNEVFVNALRFSTKVGIMASEEEESPIIIPDHLQGKYVVAFDPLDGSSNIDANVSIGSIFGIWRQRNPGTPGSTEDLLQAGKDMVCAGYCMYGSSTQIVLSMGQGVHGFTLDPSIGEFILTHPDIRVPAKGAIYSINEGNSLTWDEAVSTYVRNKKDPQDGSKPYSLRYVGSMVADVHRTLLYGGIFMYPADKKSPQGKLRLLYECYPMAFIVEQAGGKCISRAGERLLDIVPSSIHQRSPIILGSPQDVEEVEACYAASK